MWESRFDRALNNGHIAARVSRSVSRVTRRRHKRCGHVAFTLLQRDGSGPRIIYTLVDTADLRRASARPLLPFLFACIFVRPAENTGSPRTEKDDGSIVYARNITKEGRGKRIRQKETKRKRKKMEGKRKKKRLCVPHWLCGGRSRTKKHIRSGAGQKQQRQTEINATSQRASTKNLSRFS